MIEFLLCSLLELKRNFRQQLLQINFRLAVSTRFINARDIAHRLAHKERRSIAQVVERALELYEQQEHDRESASEFWNRFARDFRSDADLEALIEDHREPHPGIEL